MLLVVVGTLAVAAVVVDTTLTTLSLTGGAGPLTGRLGQGMWRVLCRLAGKGPRRHRVLRWTGPLVLLTTFLAWIAGLWLGWFLVFTAYPDAVLDPLNRPAGAWSRLYFAGFSIFTLGVGDYVPGTTVAQICTSLAVLSGLFLVTLGITYLMQVVAAVVDKRTIAGHIAALGDDPVDILRRAWTGQRFSSMFEQHLTSLTPEVVRTGERHLAFPVLHYFHVGVAAKSAPVAVSVLDGAVLLLRHGVRAEDRPDPGAVGPLSRALQELVHTLEDTFIPPVESPLPAPELTALAHTGIPVGDEQTYAQAVARAQRHRRRLRGWCASDGWDERELRLAGTD
ncbi:potassium channel family protein [Micromonospora sp. WMMD998]|uniref:potassium channel family protein n=1 Tax=Micromonospora sp. WMMD998 TaxID=3016092 RepID=UPI00249A6860|nr:potassium channel family protein [Micromonospora sp. WMMD998]WFE39520.1 potassium channel family protein [Micromonospora sp. WMMD998]